MSIIEVSNPVAEAVAEIQRNPGLVREDAIWKGIYEVEQWRGGKLIHRDISHNLVTLEGRRYIVDIAMKGATNVFTIHQNFYVLLSATNTTPNATTMKYDAKQFTEFNTFKAPTTARPGWTGVLDGSASSMTNNLSKASFTIGANPSTPVYGAGLVTLDTLGDSTTGDYLISFSLFTSSVTVAEDDIIKVGITVSLS